MATTHEEMLERYARVALGAGLNLQDGQRLVVYAPVQAAALVRLVNAEAYRMGSPLVTVIWTDEDLVLTRLKNAPRDTLGESPAWIGAGIAECLKRGDAYLGVVANTPGLLASQDPAAVSELARGLWQMAAPVNALISDDATNWVLVCAATGAWSSTVFPPETGSASLDSLWQALFHVCRIDDPDPIAAWQSHVENLRARCEWLNHKHYAALHFYGPGTDIALGLPSGHVWTGGRTLSRNGIPFIANLPTEEVFTCPHRAMVNGTVASTLPLDYAGTTIRDLTLTFSSGLVVGASAAAGEAALTGLLATDGGSSRVGEVALVPHSSLVSQSRLLFHNGLLDENAASHLALGSAYRACLAGTAGMTDEQFEAAGGNTSTVHVDFMVGSEEISVEGLLSSGELETVMINGEWSFQL